jgi:hypothetical protein
MMTESAEGANSISADTYMSTITTNPTINPITDAQRTFVLNLQSQYRGYVRARINKVLNQCGDLGLGYDPVLGMHTDPLALKSAIDEIEGTVWIKVIESVDAWMRPGFSNAIGRPSAKLSTRLSDAAMWQTLGWQKSQLRSRARFVGLDDGARIEAALFDRARGYGRYYPESLKPHPLDETPKKNTKPPFDYSAKLLCAQCEAMQTLMLGFVVDESNPDPALTLRCGHMRQLSGTAPSEYSQRAAA